MSVVEGVRSLELGASFRADGAPHLALQYTIKPQGVDSSRAGNLTSTQNEDWQLTLPKKQSEEPYVFDGKNKEDSDVDCVLLYDAERDVYIIERLHTISLTRSDKRPTQALDSSISTVHSPEPATPIVDTTAAAESIPTPGETQSSAGADEEDDSDGLDEDLDNAFDELEADEREGQAMDVEPDYAADASQAGTGTLESPKASPAAVGAIAPQMTENVEADPDDDFDLDALLEEDDAEEQDGEPAEVNGVLADGEVEGDDAAGMDLDLDLTTSGSPPQALQSPSPVRASPDSNGVSNATTPNGVKRGPISLAALHGGGDDDDDSSSSGLSSSSDSGSSSSDSSSEDEGDEGS
ncbi:hypothetical protein HK097_003296 [Rhizophlyctis rosea]|uniref:Transcription elongation factor Eaf N-terminal domain-containing protein n=1 Tax=Rhizophlyctis rosea TaxID=64517 RepID=A0AAD5SGP3_9FUNG|nr:hypothetical protein HK097_003296 [Rhizophlyctis rosea]